MKFQNVVKDLRAVAEPAKAKELSRFFKTAPGDYGHGDKFLGVVVPKTRKVASKYRELPLIEIKKLLASSYHEERLCGLVILTLQFKREKDFKKQKLLFNFYMKQARKGRINNWDLIDVTAPTMGIYLLQEKDYLDLLLKLAKSKSLWLKRLSILFTFAFIKNNKFQPTLIISKQLLADNHDLIHKAVGWALREVGKKDEQKLINFLKANVKNMHRTTLRYSIEKFPERERKYWLSQ